MSKTNSSSSIAVVVHIHYVDTLEPILRAIKKSALKTCDFYFTVTPSLDTKEIELKIKSEITNSFVDIFDNQGRDILPFFKTIKKHELINNYDAILKLHGKKTVALPGYGAFWFVDSLNKLIPKTKTQIAIIKETLNHVGVIGPAGQLFEYDPLTDKNHKYAESIMKTSNVSFDKEYSRYFFGGSMLWFDSATLELFMNIDNLEGLFPIEGGQLDGTVAHAVERLFTLMPANVNKTKLHVIDMGQDIFRESAPQDVSIDGLIRSYEEFSNMAVIVNSEGNLYTLDYPEFKKEQEKWSQEKINLENAIGSVDQPDNLYTQLARVQDELVSIKSSKKYKLLEKYSKARSKIKIPGRRGHA